MRKKYIYFILSLMCAFSLNAQSVTLTPTAVNGSGYSSGPINLGGTPNSTISLGVTVKMPSDPGNNGTLTIYSSNGVNTNVVTGGNSRQLYFGGGNSGSDSFVINLYWTDYATSGYYLYAEYKTSSNKVHKSTNLPIIKNATMTTGTTLNPPADAPDPTKIVNTLCCNQTVRLGDKPQTITGSTYLNPYDREPYGINSRWTYFGEMESIDYINQTLNIDYTTQLGTFTVERSLGYIYGNQFPNNSNKVTVTVVPSPILTNTIGVNNTNISINSEGYYELSSLKPINIIGTISKVNLNILENPSHITDRSDIITNADSYKWEYKNNKLANNPWITIPNETNEDLNFSNPTNLADTEDINYLVRRIAIYKNIQKVSNPIKIAVKGLRYNNTICCDQVLKIRSLTDYDAPNEIIGSIPTIDQSSLSGTNFSIFSIDYQWQVLTLNRSQSTWTDIAGATSKDYQPPLSSIKVIESGGRRGSAAFSLESSFNYRRITKINYQIYNPNFINKIVTSYSNEISLTGTSSEPSINAYPNPTSSVLYIESALDLSNANVTISNVTGNIVTSNNYSVINPKLISLNVSNLATGTYFITISHQNLGTIQRTFIKQ